MEDIKRCLEENGITSVRFEQSDMYGVPHSRCIPVKHFEKMATNGLNISLCFMAFHPSVGRTAENTGICEEISFADCVAFPDLDTFQILPWCTKAARVLVEGEWKGERAAVYPRVTARRQLDRLEEHGLSLWSAHEHEFYLVKRDTLEPVFRVMHPFATITIGEYDDIFQQILVDLPRAGVNIECMGCENGQGQIEITYRPEFGIKAADTAHTYRLGIKEIALKHGCIASFMSKPWPDTFGNSAHYCHSLWDADGKVSKLYDPCSPSGLSEIGQHWVAGLVAHARAIAVFMAPTTNCLKRYKRHSFAPWNATWGLDNRSCAVRVKIQGGSGTYIENRMGASACSPYVSMAATVAAGLDGIIRKLPLPKEVIGSAYMDENIPPGTETLPDNMEEAVEALLADDVITTALGPEFIKCFVACKRFEIELEKEATSKGNVAEWERETYFFMM